MMIWHSIWKTLQQIKQNTPYFQSGDMTPFYMCFLDSSGNNHLNAPLIDNFFSRVEFSFMTSFAVSIVDCPTQLINLYLGFSFVFHDKAKRRQQGICYRFRKLWLTFGKKQPCVREMDISLFLINQHQTWWPSSSIILWTLSAVQWNWLVIHFFCKRFIAAPLSRSLFIVGERNRWVNKKISCQKINWGEVMCPW